MDTSKCIRLIEELAVGVGPEQRLPHSRQGTVLEQRQPRLEGVVDLDLAVPADDEHTSGTIRATLACLVFLHVMLPFILHQQCPRWGQTCPYLPSATGFASSILALHSLPSFSLYSLEASSMALRTAS